MSTVLPDDTNSDKFFGEKLGKDFNLGFDFNNSAWIFSSILIDSSLKSWAVSKAPLLLLYELLIVNRDCGKLINFIKLYL